MKAKYADPEVADAVAASKFDRDISRPLLDDAETRRYRHVNSEYGRSIAYGMRHMKVYEGTFNLTNYIKRRRKNKQARKSRAINRKRA